KVLAHAIRQQSLFPTVNSTSPITEQSAADCVGVVRTLLRKCTVAGKCAQRWMLVPGTALRSFCGLTLRHGLRVEKSTCRKSRAVPAPKQTSRFTTARTT